MQQTSGLCDAVTMTPMVARVFLERSVASRPMRNMTWSRSLALVLNPAVPYCSTRASGFVWRADFRDTSSNCAIPDRRQRSDDDWLRPRLTILFIISFRPWCNLINKGLHFYYRHHRSLGVLAFQGTLSRIGRKTRISTISHATPCIS